MKNTLLLLILISSFLSWLNPFHYGIWPTAHSEFFIFFSLIFSFGYTLYIHKKIILYRHDLLFLLIGIIPLIQYIFGKVLFFGDAIIASIYLYSFVLALAIGRTLAISSEQCEKIFIIFSVLVVFSALTSFYAQLSQWFMFGKYIVFIAEIPPVNARPFANFAQPNTLATFYLIALFSVIYLYEKSRIDYLITTLLTIILLFGIALTQSRTPWVFLLCFIIWWLWKGLSLELTKIKSYQIFIFSSVFTLFTLLIPYVSELLLLSAYSLEDRLTGGMARLNMWQQMLIAISNQPLSGYGWQQVSNAQIVTTLQFSHYEWTEHAHNILLDLLIWNGIPLGIVIISLIIIWIKRFIYLAGSIEGFWFLCAIGAVIVHSMFEYPLEYAFFLLPIGFIFGLIQSYSNKNSLITFGKNTSLIILICSTFLYSVILFDYSKLEKDMMLARFEVLNIGNLHANHKTPDVILLTQLQAKIGLVRTQPRNNMTEQEIEEVRKAAYRHASSSALHRYAQVLALNGKLLSAQEHLNILEKMYGKKYSLASLYDVQPTLAFEWMNQGASK